MARGYVARLPAITRMRGGTGGGHGVQGTTSEGGCRAGDRCAGAGRRCAARPAAAPVPEASPSMAQFLEIKAANPDSLLWYRMGDFYELFFDDAVVASAALGIVLTKRGKHLGEDIPMCGVPIHRADEYLQRLIRLGYRVAVCEQLEDPAEARKRGSKAVVRRDVVRLVTPGTLTEDALLDAKARNYLTALFRAPGRPASAGIGAGCHGRARLARHLDRGVRGRRGQGRGSAGRARPARARRGDPRRSAARRRRRSSAGSSTPAPRRRRFRRPISTASRASANLKAQLARRRARRLRHLHARRARRHRGACCNTSS